MELMQLQVLTHIMQNHICHEKDNGATMDEV